MPVLSAQMRMVEGAVSDLGDRLSQAPLLVVVQLRVPPPVLLIPTNLPPPQGRVIPPLNGMQRETEFLT